MLMLIELSIPIANLRQRIRRGAALISLTPQLQLPADGEGAWHGKTDALLWAEGICDNLPLCAQSSRM